MVDDLPLFAAFTKPAAPAEVRPDLLREVLDAINPDDLSPRAALEALYALKKARAEG
jgi:DNA mismatch repair protein MutS